MVPSSELYSTVHTSTSACVHTTIESADSPKNLFLLLEKGDKRKSRNIALEHLRNYYCCYPRHDRTQTINTMRPPQKPTMRWDTTTTTTGRQTLSSRQAPSLSSQSPPPPPPPPPLSLASAGKLMWTGATVGTIVDSLHNQVLLEYHVAPIAIPSPLFHSSSSSIIFASSWTVPPLLAVAYLVLGAILPRLVGGIVSTATHRPKRSATTRTDDVAATKTTTTTEPTLPTLSFEDDETQPPSSSSSSTMVQFY